MHVIVFLGHVMNVPAETTLYSLLILPPSPVDKTLTANCRPSNLSEHMLAFLNYHNKNGFLTEEASGDEPTLKGLLIQMRSLSRMNMSHIKRFVSDIEKVTHGEITEYLGREVVAINYGYSNYLELHENLTKNNYRYVELRNNEVTNLPDTYTRPITWDSVVVKKIRDLLYTTKKPLYIDPAIRFDLLIAREVVQLAYNAKQQGITYGQLRDLANEIKCSSIKKYPHQKALHIVFQLIGYDDYAHWKRQNWEAAKPPTDAPVLVPNHEDELKQIIELIDSVKVGKEF